MSPLMTQRFVATIGVTPGYDHHNESHLTVEDFAVIWDRISLLVVSPTGYYVSGIITESCAIYPQQFGCPVGGERVFTISGNRNPKYALSLDTWKNSVKDTVFRVSRQLDQTTAQVVFDEVEMVYFSQVSS